MGMTFHLDTIISTLTYQPASDLPEGAVYWRVASLDAAGNQSAYDGDQFMLDITPPPAISGLTAQRQGIGVDLVWAPLAGPPADFARFRIYRAEPRRALKQIEAEAEALSNKDLLSLSEEAEVSGASSALHTRSWNAARIYHRFAAAGKVQERALAEQRQVAF